MLTQISFFALAILTLASAVMVVTARHVVHSIMALIVTLFSVGGLFLMLRAEFLFAVQIVLYVGGIMVLFLFVVMLVNLDANARQAQFGRRWPVAIATAAALLAELGYAIKMAVETGGVNLNLPSVETHAAAGGNTQQVALALFRPYALPVEIASILLLVAMVGAVVMAKRKLE